MTFFFRFFRTVIENGYLYLAQPPLYRYKKGKSETYLKDDKALNEFLIKSGIEGVVESKTMSKYDLVDFFKLVAYYKSILKELEKRFSLSEIIRYMVENQDIIGTNNRSLAEKLDKYIESLGFNILNKTVDENSIHYYIQTKDGLEELKIDERFFRDPYYNEAIYVYNKILNRYLELDLTILDKTLEKHLSKIEDIIEDEVLEKDSSIRAIKEKSSKKSLFKRKSGRDKVLEERLSRKYVREIISEERLSQKNIREKILDKRLNQKNIREKISKKRLFKRKSGRETILEERLSKKKSGRDKIIEERLSKNNIREKILDKRLSQKNIREKILEKRLSQKNIREKILEKRLSQKNIRETILEKRLSQKNIRDKVLEKRLSHKSIREKILEKRLNQKSIRKKIFKKRLNTKKVLNILDEIFLQAKKGAYIQRYKGLGEMNPEQLWETTMDPQNRRLLQITIGDVDLADETFTLFMGDEVEPRRDFIEQHAKDVKHLDV